MVRHHHERLDGSGYPDGLAGDEIPLGARIIAVADTFDAITSVRPYRPPRKQQAALKILKEEAGTRLDAAGRRGIPQLLLGPQDGRLVLAGRGGARAARRAS